MEAGGGQVMTGVAWLTCIGTVLVIAVYSVVSAGVKVTLNVSFPIAGTVPDAGV